MIQKYLKIQASKESVLEELCAVEAWPEWYPGVQSVRVTKNELALSVADVVFRSDSRTAHMTLEIARRKENALKIKQLKGVFKSYSADWELLPSPTGVGTTAKITLVVDAGMLVPKGMLYAKLSEGFNQFEEAINKRLQGKEIKQLEPAAQKQFPQIQSEAARAETSVKKLAHIFQTKKGLEVWVSGKRYFMKSIR